MCAGGETCATCFADCGACTTCAAGKADCDGIPLNGCECSTPACCAGACQVQHSNGLGQSYYDCGALGTPGTAASYTQAMATAARAAWPTTGTDSNGACSGTVGVGVFRQNGSSCAVWVYTGTSAGRVRLNTVNNTCYCPTVSDPAWD